MRTLALTMCLLLLFGCKHPVKIQPSSQFSASSQTGNQILFPELSNQAHIYSRIFEPQENSKWVDHCLNLSLDQDIFGCRIIAYRIQWFSGKWSGWFVPGINDLYKKPGEPLRRFWACFNDHTFEIIYQTSSDRISFQK